MNRASPIELRKALEAVSKMANAGIRFVPMPAKGEDDALALWGECFARLDAIAAQIEAEEAEQQKGAV